MKTLGGMMKLSQYSKMLSYMESLKDGRNDALVESIKVGFTLIESEQGGFDVKATEVTDANVTRDGDVNVEIYVDLTGVSYLEDLKVKLVEWHQSNPEGVIYPIEDYYIQVEANGNVTGNWNGGYYAATDVSPEEGPELEDLDVVDIEFSAYYAYDGNKIIEVGESVKEAVETYLYQHSDKLFNVKEYSQMIPAREDDGDPGYSYEY